MNSNTNTKKRILLVGGAGFIGHHLALELRSQGNEVWVLDSLQVNNLGALAESHDENASKYISFVHERLQLLRKNEIQVSTSDARDYNLLSRDVSEFQPDVVIHLAAVAHANRSNKNPKATFDHSLRTLENALDASRKGKPHLIYFSSSMVYGDFDGATVTEDKMPKPKGIYGSLKLAGELMVQSYSEVFDIPSTIVRPSALYGERCVSRRVGQAFIENAIDSKVLTINGDGEEELDFTYVRDVVGGVVSMISSPASIGETFNLTFGQGRKINDLAKLVIARFPGLEVEYRPRDSLMPERGTLDNSKIRSLLGYESSFAIEQGFNLYIDWYQNRAESI